MKQNGMKYYLYAMGFLYGILIVMALMFFTSCSSPEKLMQKFYKKGGKIECKGDTLTIEKVVKGKDGKDSLIYVPHIEYVPHVEVQTKWMYRMDKKALRDSLKHTEKIHKLDIKKLDKENKTAEKLKDKELKALEIQLKAEQKKNKASVFWTWIGKRWWLIALISFISGGFLVFKLK